jgi:tetratricopeptide (TPR) repeat protein
MSPSLPERCCNRPDPIWHVDRVSNRWADVLGCRSCGQTHKVEDWATAVHGPQAGRCVNCGGPLSATPEGDPTCRDCSLSVRQCEVMHRKLAARHPDGSFLSAAQACAHAGRVVLGLKLATADLAYRGSSLEALETKVQCLEGMGLVEEALSTAWIWVDQGGAPKALATIAALEAARGNLDGTFDALQRGLRMDPNNTEMWTDLAELLAHLDQRDPALEAAGHGLLDPKMVERCLEVIAAIAERYYAVERLDLVIETTERAGDHKRHSAKLAWLTARVAADLQQWEEAAAWLQVVVDIDPSHEEAQAALAQLAPQSGSRGGLLNWFKSR